jgi:hypothetical protein
MRCAWLLSSLALLSPLLATVPAHGQTTPGEDPATARRHLLSAELGTFQIVKEEGLGVAIGASYAYRLLKGLEVGVGFRYLVIPSHEADDQYVPQQVPEPGQPLPPPEHYVHPALQLGFAGISLRGFIPLDSADRFELGLTARAGLLAITNKSGVCCTQVAVAPDLRVKIARNTALQLAPELAIGRSSYEPYPGSDYHEHLYFLQYGAWLSVVQAF